MATAEVFVTVVSVLNDHAKVLKPFVGEVSRLLEANYRNFEILLVDNDSRDETSSIVHDLLRETKCLRYLRLSRKVEDETATMAGLDAAIGDFVITIDPDLDPPEEIEAMVEKCRTGSELVIGLNVEPPPANLIYRTLRNGLFVLARWLVGVELVQGVTRYRVMSRLAVNALTRVRHRRQYFAVVASSIGLTIAYHPYKRIARSGRSIDAPLLKALRIGASLIVHNSITPLRMVSCLGLMGSIASFLYTIYVVVIFLIKKDVMPGWTTLSLQVSGLFFLAFVMLTLIGEYLGRVLEETTDRPLYYIPEERASSIMLIEPGRRNVLEQSEDQVQTSRGFR